MMAINPIYGAQCGPRVQSALRLRSRIHFLSGSGQHAAGPTAGRWWPKAEQKEDQTGPRCGGRGPTQTHETWPLRHVSHGRKELPWHVSLVNLRVAVST